MVEQDWKTVRVFVSSTFSDMHAERAHLVERVFPVLREWCEARRLLLVDVDLRWGITEADAHGGRVVPICLRRIDECQPFFVCFIGQRYGAGVSATNARSITELEIVHAAVQRLRRPRRKPPDTSGVFFYIRDDQSLSALPEDEILLRHYTDLAVVDPVERSDLVRRRARLVNVEIPGTGRPLVTYQAHWDPRLTTPELRIPTVCPFTTSDAIRKWRSQWKSVGVDVAGTNAVPDALLASALEINRRVTTGRFRDFSCGRATLAERVLQDLKSAIVANFPDRAEAIVAESEIARELDEQSLFQKITAEEFSERTQDVHALEAYVRSSDRRPLILTGTRGAGKTTLLAGWLGRFQPPKGTTRVTFRFAQASRDSQTIDGALRSILLELRADGYWSEPVADRREEIFLQFYRFLTYTSPRTPIAIVIDGLDRFESEAGEMEWVPLELAAGTRLVLSVASDAELTKSWLDRLTVSSAAIVFQLNPLSHAEGAALIRRYLARYLKRLDNRQIDALLRAPGSRSPLFLKVILSELRVAGTHHDLDQRIATRFGASPQSAFSSMLERLESEAPYGDLPAESLTCWIFGFLSHARAGLSIDELIALITAQQGGTVTQSRRLAVTDALQLCLRQVQEFIRLHRGRISFVHDSFRLAAVERYARFRVGIPPEQGWHGALADYFYARGTADTWQGTDGRALEETAHHAIEGLRSAMCIDILTDERYRHAFFNALGSGRYGDVVRKFADATAKDPSLRSALQDVIRRIAFNEFTSPLIFTWLAPALAADATAALQFLKGAVDTPKEARRAAFALRVARLAARQRTLKALNEKQQTPPTQLSDKVSDKVLSFLDHPDKYVRWEAATSYEALVSTRQPDRLLKCAESETEHPLIRAEAARQLGKLSDAPSIARLESLARSSLYPLRMFAARSARRLAQRCGLEPEGPIDDWRQPDRHPPNIVDVLQQLGPPVISNGVVSSGDGRPVLIHIVEDDAMSVEGQWYHIQLLERILRRLPCRLVCMESGAGDVSLLHFRERATLDFREDVGVDWLHRLQMKGEEYLQLTSDFDFALWGVDEPRLLSGIVEAKRAGRKALEQVASVDRALTMIRNCLSEMETRKSQVTVLMSKRLPAYQVGRLCGEPSQWLLERLLPERVPKNLAGHVTSIQYVQLECPTMRGDLFEIDVNYAHSIGGGFRRVASKTTAS